MSRPATLRTRADFLGATGVLLIVRDVPPTSPPTPGQPPAVPPDPAEGVEILLSVWDDGRVVALHGHVDLGTGIRTAITQIVAEELDVPMSHVEMRMGDTALAPNQGATIASASIQIHAGPLRLAAAQARAFLVDLAAAAMGIESERLIVSDGVVRVRETDEAIAYGALLTDRHIELQLDLRARVKPVADYVTVGKPVPRVDIPAKATGGLVFVHDMRMPGMLHGRVVRPPYAGADHGDFIGNTLDAVDEASIAHIPGIRAVVVIRDFIGIVADREEHAEQAAAQLTVRWKPWPGLPPTDDVAAALSANPSTARRLVDEGDVDAAIAGAARPMDRTYLWPYQMHASLGPSCAVAAWHGDVEGPHRVSVWAGTQNPHVLRAELARLVDVDAPSVEVIRMEAAGCYGRNGADDVAADAVLLSRAVGAPVRVQLTREQEHLWEPKGAAQWMTVRGGLAADGSVAAYDFATSYPSNGAPTLAMLLTRTITPQPHAFEMGDRTARPPYDYANLRVTVNDMPPILRASWLRGVSALPNSFAHESYVDELATAAGVDPVVYRLQQLRDPRARELIEATAAKAGWVAHTQPQQQGATGDLLHGRGVAYARYVHSAWPGFGAAWSAWIADVDVDRRTGEVHVTRVVVGQDAGLMINPAGVRHQIHGNAIQTTSRALRERVRTDPVTNVVASREWGSYPILGFRDVPVIEVVTMPRDDQPPLGTGESSSVPGTAAIANAIFDATGVRFRQPPFTAEVVRAALQGLPPPRGEGRGGGERSERQDGSEAHRALRAPPPQPSPRGGGSPARWGRRAVLLASGLIGATAAVLGIRSTIAPVTRPDSAIYTAATIERGRQLAAIGNCIGCHTVKGGAPYAGGFPLETPFGTVYGTNLTPDVETGIGAWSFSAFQRAMREGVSRDGHRLYPAFPYTAFTRTTDDDLNALYAWLMAQPAVRNDVPATRLAFPFGVRPLMALWNGIYLSPGIAQSDPTHSTQWRRGAYLVDGLGHCGACHTGRDALGAERTGNAYLAGAMVDGWEAPALTALANSPVPWTETAFFDYLRSGYSAEHGAATGPMAPVVRELVAASDADLRAMAHYLASFATKPDEATAHAMAMATIAEASRASPLPDATQRLFESACGACHHDGDGPRLLGVNVPLALATKLHADTPDNLLRVILEGVRAPAGRDVGFMPAFADAFDDRQVIELVAWMRRRFAPGGPPWKDLPATVARIRADATKP
ncbi:MAG: molybdopterin cofactor-binding domain-containing protein [Burkholderiaceae bacterium]